MTAPPNPESKSNSGKFRQLALIGVLVLLVIGLIYDYTVARPSVDLAYDSITDQSAKVNMSSTSVFTNEDVQALLNKSPSRSFEEPNGDFVEVYSWRSGLPIRTHDLFAVYKKNGGQWLFQRHAKYKHESSTEVSKYDAKEAIVIDVGEDSPEDPAADAARVGGEPGTGGGGPGARRVGGGGSGGFGPGGGGGNFDPDAIFTENDADGDGLLSGDEIMERARENLAEIDSDGDQAISREEWTARVEAMRARSGGGGAAGGRPRDAGRPEADAEDAPAATDEQE